MIYHELSNGLTITALHKRRCGWCSEPVHKGEICKSMSYNCDGRLVYGYQHLDCNAAMQRDRLSDAGWEGGAHRRGSTLKSTITKEGESTK